MEDYENQDRGKAKSVEKKRAKIRKELEEDGDFSDGDMETSSDKKMETSNQTQGDWDHDITDGETETSVERQRKYTKQKEVDEDCGISDAEKKTSVQGTRKSKKKSREQEDGDIVGGDKVLPRRGRSAKKSETKKETDYDTMGDTSRCKSSTSSVEILSMTTRKMKQAKGFEVKSWLQERDVLVLPSRVKADITQNLSIARHDYKIWKQIEKDISLCRGNYVRVTNVCREHKGKLAETSLVISSLFNKCLDFDNQDTLAHSLIPRDGNIDRSDSFEIMTRAVRDCLLDAISRLVYGNQNHARELRTRMTLEAVLYADWYLLDENLGINLPQLDTGYTLAERYSLFSGTEAKDYTTTYQQEVIRCFKSGQYCALWQIHQLSSVIGRPIICLFPEFEDVEDEAPLRYYHNRTIYPREVEKRGEEPVTIMWSKASPLEEGLAVVNHIVPVVRRYPVVKVLFTGEIEEGALTDEHIFLYENMAPQGDQKNEKKTVVESEKESEKESISDVSISNEASGGSGKDTRRNKLRKRTHRGIATKNVLPRQRNFVPTPGYSVLSNSEKDRRNKELAQQNREALQAMREKCKVVITPIDQTANGIALLTKTPEKEQVRESYGDIANENKDEHLGPEDQLLTVKDEYVASPMETGSTVDDMEATNAESRKVNQDAHQQNAETKFTEHVANWRRRKSSSRSLSRPTKH